MKPLYDDPVWMKKRQLKEDIDTMEMDGTDSFDGIGTDGYDENSFSLSTDNSESEEQFVEESQVVKAFRVYTIEDFTGDADEITLPDNILEDLEKKPDGSFTVTGNSPSYGKGTKMDVKFVHFSLPNDSLEVATFVEADLRDNGRMIDTYYYGFIEQHKKNELTELFKFIISSDEYEFEGRAD